MMHTLVIVYTLLHAYMYITAEIHLDERAFASCSFHDMTLQKFRRFNFSFFCYKKTGNSFMWVDDDMAMLKVPLGMKGQVE